MANSVHPMFFLKFVALFTSIALLFLCIGIYAPPPSSPALNDIEPTQPVTVVLDAGHGGEDGGACTYGGMSEKDLNLLIAKELYCMLSASGINVIMTRSEDILLYDPSSDYKGHKKSLDLAARLKIAKDTPGAILVSIHMNAFPEPQYGGLQVYYSANSEGSRTLAELICQNDRSWLSPSNNRKPKAAGSNIYLLDRFEGTGILIECGFLSNPSDREKLNSAEYRNILSTAIFCSILQYISAGGM